jgi:hypothetical protein
MAETKQATEEGAHGYEAPAAADLRESGAPITVNVNGRSPGEVVSGPPAMTGKWVAPTQFAVLKDQKDYHGHLLLSDSQEETRLAEAELDLMRERAILPESVRAGMIFTYHGVGGRIEDISESGDTATVNLGGVMRPMSVAQLLRDASFDEDRTMENEQLTLGAEDLVQLEEAEINLVEEVDPVIVKKLDDAEDQLLEAKTDDQLFTEAMERLALIEKRKSESSHE